jgi:uncharacterized protein
MMRRLKFVGVLLIVAALGSCAGRHDLQPDRGQVRVEVATVGYDQQTGSHYVLLEDSAGQRSLPILIGNEEARAIAFALHGIKPPRPLTSDLLRTVIQSTGNRVDRVVIGDVRDQVFYAKIYLDHERYQVDSRPSDAIALAMGVNAPIYVAARLFEVAGAKGPALTSTAPETARGFGMTVQELTPELAGYFTVAPRSGVLVADATGDAERAGVQPGDIVTEVEKRPVRTPSEFEQIAAKVKSMPLITLVLRRGTTERVVTIKPSMAAAGEKR